jgi:hypothetical protein
MYNFNMSLCRQIFICLFINFSFVRSSSVISNKFNITLKTPGNASSPTALPHVCVILIDLFLIYRLFLNRNQYMLNITFQMIWINGRLVR